MDLGLFCLEQKETTYYWTVFISFINEGAYHSSFLISSSLLFPLDVATFIAQQMTRKGLTVPPLSLPGMELKVGWLHAINYPCSLTLLTLCSKQKKERFFHICFIHYSSPFMKAKLLLALWANNQIKTLVKLSN